MQAEAERGCWRVEGLPLRIDYSTPVVEDICALAVEGLTRLRRGGVEVGGILFGTRRGPEVQILAHRPLPCEHAHGPSFSLSDRDLEGLAELLEAALHDGALRGLEPVGWYHSHTRSEVCLTAEDLEFHGRYFPEPWQVAMVVRPAQFGPSRVGFFFREPDGSIQAEASYLEFPVRARRRAPPAAAAVGGGASLTPAASPAAPVPTVAPPVPAPSFALVEPRRPRKWLWVAGIVLAVLAAGYGLRTWWPLAAAPPSVTLRVLDLDGQLIIEWDRASQPVRKARRATFEILDGDQRQVVEMEGDRLREGSLTYARRTEKVDVRCRVEASGAAPVEEFIRFLGQPPPVRPAPDQAEVLRQRDELQQQVERLRAELALRNAQLRRLQPRATQPAQPPPSAPPAPLR